MFFFRNFEIRTKRYEFRMLDRTQEFSGLLKYQFQKCKKILKKIAMYSKSYQIHLIQRKIFRLFIEQFFIQFVITFRNF